MSDPEPRAPFDYTKPFRTQNGFSVVDADFCVRNAYIVGRVRRELHVWHASSGECLTGSHFLNLVNVEDRFAVGDETVDQLFEAMDVRPTGDAGYDAARRDSVRAWLRGFAISVRAIGWN